ncbi:MAG: M48 family metalloprotease [Planctomycetaceae bacterium]|nr:M48 family metalloprotease [Planctomycetaceae bacterium]
MTAENKQPVQQTTSQPPQENDTETTGIEQAGNLIGDMFDLGISTLEKASRAENPADLVDIAADGVDSAARSALKTADGVLPATLDDEIKFGKMFNKEILKDSTTKEVDEKDKRLYSVWKKLRPKRTDIKYRLFVIEKDTVNAFAHAGGYVYIYTGLIDKSDDAMLAFVLAHEISHIDLKHVCAGLGRLKAMENIPGNELMNAVANRLSPSYSQDNELEADTAGWQLALDAGYKSKDMIKFFDIIPDTKKSPKKIDSDNTAIKIANQAERIMYRLEHHFDTHPQPSKRKNRLLNK